MYFIPFLVMSSLRRFRVGKIAPFGGNLAFVVYRCLETSEEGRERGEALMDSISFQVKQGEILYKSSPMKSQLI